MSSDGLKIVWDIFTSFSVFFANSQFIQYFLLWHRWQNYLMHNYVGYATATRVKHSWRLDWNEQWQASDSIHLGVLKGKDCGSSYFQRGSFGRTTCSWFITRPFHFLFNLSFAPTDLWYLARFTRLSKNKLFGKLARE